MNIGPADLAAIEEIKRLKARYSRCMHMQELDRLNAKFASDAEYDARDTLRNGCRYETPDQRMGPEWINHGLEAIVAFIRNALAGMVSVHRGMMPEFEIQSDIKALGVWPMQDSVQKHAGDEFALRLDGEGHYWETYRKIDGRWTIQTSRLTCLCVNYWQAA